jgi:hypothetical protein
MPVTDHHNAWGVFYGSDAIRRGHDVFFAHRQRYAHCGHAVFSDCDDGTNCDERDCRLGRRLFWTIFVARGNDLVVGAGQFASAVVEVNAFAVGGATTKTAN